MMPDGAAVRLVVEVAAANPHYPSQSRRIAPGLCLCQGRTDHRYRKATTPNPIALCAANALHGFTPVTSERSPTFPSKASPSPCACTFAASSAIIFPARETSSPSSCPGLVEHYACRTSRSDRRFTHVPFSLVGEAGARLLR
jgi:hypothetical protein